MSTQRYTPKFKEEAVWQVVERDYLLLAVEAWLRVSGRQPKPSPQINARSEIAPTAPAPYGLAHKRSRSFRERTAWCCVARKGQ